MSKHPSDGTLSYFADLMFVCDKSLTIHKFFVVCFFSVILRKANFFPQKKSLTRTC